MKRPALAIVGTFPRFEVHEQGKCLAAFKYRHQAEEWAARYLHRPTARAFKVVMSVLGAIAIIAAVYAMPAPVLELAALLILSGATVAGGVVWLAVVESKETATNKERMNDEN